MHSVIQSPRNGLILADGLSAEGRCAGAPASLRVHFSGFSYNGEQKGEKSALIKQNQRQHLVSGAPEVCTGPTPAERQREEERETEGVCVHVGKSERVCVCVCV